MKWGYGLTIFGILGFIATMTNKETMNLQNFFITLFFVFLGIFLIIKNNNNKKNVHNNINKDIKTNDMNCININNVNSIENIIYPIHIKYKKIEMKEKTYQNEKLTFWRDLLGPNNELLSTNQPTYNCMLDNKIVATLSSGQEMDLDLALGEHVIFFELVNNLPRNKIKNK